MPKRVDETELRAVLDRLREMPGGGSAADIGRALGESTARRTLQRRLAALVRQGRLLRERRGPGTRYRLPAAPTAHRPVPVLTFHDGGPAYDALIPLSDDGARVGRMVRAPIQRRRPVGYNRAFLDDYVPGATWYLPSALRERLMERGRSPDQEGVAGTHARKLHQRLLIDLSWNSSRLEGNTYSLLETAQLLETGESATGKDARETQMILNHKAAIDFLLVQAEHIGFNRHTILNLHALLAENLLPDSRAWGQLRTAPVAIAGTTYHPPEIPQVIDECFGLLLDKAAAIGDPFEQAFFAQIHIPYLQPFLDVNKRVSRMAANLPLIRRNLCPLSFVDVPARTYIDGLLGVYEANQVALARDVFCWAYERSCERYSVVRQTLGEPDPFRARHRSPIAQTIREVVRGLMDKPAAAAHVRRCAGGLPAEERARFMEIVETDLLNLHAGNIATVRLSTKAFEAWIANWR